MQIDINKKKYLFISIFLLLFLTLPHIKLYNFEATYFDLAIYINKLKFGISNYNYITDHKELIILLIYPLYLFEFVQENIGYFTLILQSTILLSPLIILRNNIKLVTLYLINPLIWNLNLFDFHTESIGLIIIFYSIYFIFNNKHKSFYLSILFLLLVKESFIPVILFLILLKNFYFKNNNIYDLLIALLIIIYSFILLNILSLDKNEIYSGFEYNFQKKDFLKIFLFYFLQIVLIFFLKEKKLFILWYLIPINLLFIFFGNVYQMNILTHHIIYIIGPLFCFILLDIRSKFNTKIYNKFFIFNLVTLLTFSAFPLSILNIVNINKTFSLQNYFISQETIEFNNYINDKFDYLNTHTVIVDNDLINNNILKINNLKPFPIIKEYNLSESLFRKNLNENFDSLIFVKNKYKDRYFLIDRIVEKDIYLNFEKKIDLNKSIIFNNENYIIYKYYK